MCYVTLCRVLEDGGEVQEHVSGTTCQQGDKVGCGIETKEDDLQYVYFMKNGERVSNRYRNFVLCSCFVSFDTKLSSLCDSD